MFENFLKLCYSNNINLNLLIYLLFSPSVWFFCFVFCLAALCARQKFLHSHIVKPNAFVSSIDLNVTISLLKINYTWFFFLWVFKISVLSVWICDLFVLGPVIVLFLCCFWKKNANMRYNEHWFMRYNEHWLIKENSWICLKVYNGIGVYRD